MRVGGLLHDLTARAVTILLITANTTAISQRLLDVASTDPGLARAVAEQGASQVAHCYCKRESPPTILVFATTP